MKTRGKMRASLTPEQVKFDSSMAEIDARRQKEGDSPRSIAVSRSAQQFIERGVNEL